MNAAYQSENRIKKLIAIDLDGTLLTTGKKITERTRQALTRAAACGLEPVIVTGRPISGLPLELEEIPGIRYAITSNGAVTTDLRTGQVLRLRLIPPETAAQIIKIPDGNSFLYSVFIDGIGYCTEYVYQTLIKELSSTVLEEYVRRSRRMTKHLMQELSESAGAENIWIVCTSPGEASELSARIRSLYQLQTFRTAPNDVEIGALGADKGTALRELFASFGLRREDVYAIGDNHNDLSMLRAAGTAIAMGNASEEIRQMAGLTAATNDEEGVAQVIDQLLRHTDFLPIV